MRWRKPRSGRERTDPKSQCRGTRRGCPHQSKRLSRLRDSLRIPKSNEQKKTAPTVGRRPPWALVCNISLDMLLRETPLYGPTIFRLST